MFAQYKKELKGYFYNMTGVVFIALVLIITGIFATIMNFRNGYPEFEQTLDSASFIFFLAVPILTMRSFAEEKSLKTDQLLYSLPTGMTRIVIGKYLAMVTVLGASTLLLCLYPVILSFYGTVNFLGSYSGIFAFFLLGCTLIAIGMFISTLTESQVISAVVTFGVFIAVYFMKLIASIIPGSDSASFICFMVLSLVIGLIVHLIVKNSTAGISVALVLAGATAVTFFVNRSLFKGVFPEILEKFALFGRMVNFIYYGIFDISAVVYYLSVILLFVYLSVHSMDKRRWA